MLKRINAQALYVITRLLFGVFFVVIGFAFEDGWPAFIFAAIFIVTALMRPVGCVGGSCKIDNSNNK